MVSPRISQIKLTGVSSEFTKCFRYFLQKLNYKVNPVRCSHILANSYKEALTGTLELSKKTGGTSIGEQIPRSLSCTFSVFKSFVRSERALLDSKSLPNSL
jgi:hypothetical protein